ncbi:hypothetical protein T11_14000 [Trichinella zimbabwensis]|uniref:Uncharacterized protein n=1 Tax=Trichinella zimbabwensis TaxID=268475 RepID=A0A0V1HY98_9BILA|nr:hypothetical protein T11_14000 [Trichinella zimbabwensis]
MHKSNGDFTTPDASKFESGSHLPVSPCPPVAPGVLTSLAYCISFCFDQKMRRRRFASFLLLLLFTGTIFDLED